MITEGINGTIKGNDECRFSRNVAMICSIRAAVIAQYLWEVIVYEENDPNDYWRRMPQKMIRTVFPFMSEHMIRNAMRELVDNRILRTAVMNDDKFDHTRWYQFTDYGRELMCPGYFA